MKIPTQRVVIFNTKFIKIILTKFLLLYLGFIFTLGKFLFKKSFYSFKIEFVI